MSDRAMSDCAATGRATRRAVLGEAHVARAEAAATPLDRRFQDFITEAAWGTLWASDALPHRERSLITIALLAAQGCDAELEQHLRATARTGASPDEVIEALMHVAVYAGVPRANNAIGIARRVFSEEGRNG